MINWFKKLFNKEEIKADPTKLIKTEEIPEDAESRLIPPLPQLPTHKINDCYRIGYDSQLGITTLTLMDDGVSMTLGLGPYEVIRLIKLLGATLDEDIIESEGDDFNDED